MSSVVVPDLPLYEEVTAKPPRSGGLSASHSLSPDAPSPRHSRTERRGPQQHRRLHWNYRCATAKDARRISRKRSERQNIDHRWGRRPRKDPQSVTPYHKACCVLLLVCPARPRPTAPGFCAGRGLSAPHIRSIQEPEARSQEAGEGRGEMSFRGGRPAVAGGGDRDAQRDLTTEIHPPRRTRRTRRREGGILFYRRERGGELTHEKHERGGRSLFLIHRLTQITQMDVGNSGCGLRDGGRIGCRSPRACFAKATQARWRGTAERNGS